MRRLIPLSLLFMVSMACGATVETVVQSSASPSYLQSFVPKPPESAPLPASISPITEISPKIIPKEPSEPYRKQFIISIFVDKNLDSSVSIPVIASIDYAIKRWNLALGYDVFSLLSGDMQLKLQYFNEIGILDGRQINGVYYANGCKNEQLIKLFIVQRGNIKDTVMHELGHAIGLAHSESDLDIMSTKRKYTFLELSQNDINRAKIAIKLKCGRLI